MVLHGAILDSKLKWKAHVAFSQLHRTTDETWGYSPKGCPLDLYDGNKTNLNLCRSGVVASDKQLHC